MCCRYTLSDLKAIAALVEAAGLGVDVDLDGAAPRHNVALTQRVPVITKRTKPKLEAMSFGLLLPARPPAKKPMLLPNARAETLLTKPSFLDATQHRRCLVPANGFYEWEKHGTTRLPHYFTLPTSPAFFFAGRTGTPAFFAAALRVFFSILRADSLRGTARLAAFFFATGFTAVSPSAATCGLGARCTATPSERSSDAACSDGCAPRSIHISTRSLCTTSS